MKDAHFTFVLFPKLELSVELQDLRERFATTIEQPEPYIQLLPPWAPAEPEEIISAIDFMSNIRKNLHPLAITVERWQISGYMIIGEITRGEEAIISLRRTLTEVEQSSLFGLEKDRKPHLVLFRVTHQDSLQQALIELTRIGKVLGVVDSLYLTRNLPDGTWQKVVRFPFGVGKVDYYGPITH